MLDEDLLPHSHTLSTYVEPSVRVFTHSLHLHSPCVSTTTHREAVSSAVQELRNNRTKQTLSLILIAIHSAHDRANAVLIRSATHDRCTQACRAKSHRV